MSIMSSHASLLKHDLIMLDILKLNVAKRVVFPTKARQNTALKRSNKK